MIASIDAAELEDDGCSVLELRQYTLHPRRRDELIEIFEREFIESAPGRSSADNSG